MEPFLRDTRHLAGRKPKSSRKPPEHPALALGIAHDPDGTPRLKLGETGGMLRRLHLHGRLDLLVEEPRYCVGRQADDRWIPCPDGRPADRFARCPQCHPLPVRECVFNPSCAACPIEFCMSPHEVYIAYHGTSKKVGMTRKAREGERLVEQGADLAFIVKEVSDRFQARNLEDRITSLFGIPQALPQRRRLGRLAQAVPRDAIEADHQKLAPRLERITGSPPRPLVAMPPGAGRPLPEVPVPVATVGHHTGRIEGAHGRFLFYRADCQSESQSESGPGPEPEPEAEPDPAARERPKGPLWALDLKDVITHPVRFDPTTKE